MTNVIFQGVRCFHDFHMCPIKPITLLVGENSSGKSTFLALTRIAWDIVEGGLSEDIFNDEPFMLGSFEQIASFRGGKAGRAKSFVVGMEIPIRSSARTRTTALFGNTATITARFVQQGSQPAWDEWVFECGQLKVIAKQSTRPTRLDITLQTPKGSQAINERIPFRGWLSVTSLLSNLGFLALQQFRDSEPRPDQQEPVLSDNEVRALHAISGLISESLGPRPFAFAPIRTRPLRTYDPLKDVAKPEGTHIPMILARTLQDKLGSGEQLRQALNAFGEASGLFKTVEIRRKGHKEGDPFQIGVKTMGRTFNLVDVGYGVSQVLPIIVDAVLNPRRSNYLLQQPEVHLHPKAQAELGSFLASLAKEHDKRFVIETHSDYMIDRICMDVRDKKYLKAEDVAILYFERTKGDVKINILEIDEFGNLVNAPSTYRQFFLQEERRLLGI